MSGPRFDDDLDYWVDNPDERVYEEAIRTATPAERLTALADEVTFFLVWIAYR